MTDFDLTAYLDRIGLTSVPMTEQGLRELQRAQLRAIPFEDIDPYLGTVPATDLPSIFAKTVTARRGGYCFELNGLLGAALQALGFDVRRSLGRVRKGAAGGGARTHLTLQVRLGGHRWLVDAGFGGPCPLVPLQIDTLDEQAAPNGVYRLRPDQATEEMVLERQTPEGWFALYGFDDAHVGDTDIEAANFLCASWPKMPFPGHLMLAGFDGDTRIGVFDRAVTRQTRTDTARCELADFGDFADLVTAQLRLNLDPDTLARVWARVQTAPGA